MEPNRALQDEANSYLANRLATWHAAFLLPLIPKGGSVLDCGCVPGSITLDMAQQCQDVSFIGIDTDSE